MESYAAIKRKEILIHAAMYANLEKITPSEISPVAYDPICMKYLPQANSQRQKIDERLPGTRDRKHGELLLNGYRVSFWGDEKISEIVVMVAQHNKCN